MNFYEYAVRDIEQLIPYARNSRTHSDEQVAQIAASIRAFGFTNPVLIDEDGGIIAGHGRVMAARKLAMTEVPVLVLAGLSETQKRAYIIADNKIALNAGWDDGMLQIELEALSDADFDLDILGFSDDELGIFLGGTGGDQEEGREELPADGNYKEQHGVIVMCADVLEQEVVFNKLVTLGYSVKVVST